MQELRSPVSDELLDGGSRLIPHALRGHNQTYLIVEKLNGGEFGETYIAQIDVPIESPTEHRKVVIKTPILDDNLPLDEKLTQLAKVYRTFLSEQLMHQRLGRLSCVARIVDHGTYPCALDNSGITSPALFIVSEYIEGERLDDYVRRCFGPPPNGTFAGIRDDKAFLELSRKIAVALQEIHQQQVVHGDIWPPNVMVRNDDPVFIDFGQAHFRQLAFGSGKKVSGVHPYVAPEGSGTVGADLYSMGGLLYYLATGDQPPPPKQRSEELKSLIVETLERRNPALMDRNAGVADIITRCLRYSQQDRIVQAEGLIQDIETFTPDPRPSLDVEGFAATAASLKESRNSLFKWMADLRLRMLRRVFEDMKHGVYDLSGDHEVIASGLTQYLSLLGPGSQYLTMSLPSFWRANNLGVNGRFLTMNRLAAQRGATIRRVFLITERDRLQEAELDAILQSHVRMSADLRRLGVQVDSAVTPSSGGHYCGFVEMGDEDRTRLVQAGGHFGLIKIDNEEIAIFPQYRDDGVIVSVQFRAGWDIGASVLPNFWPRLADSRPIELFRGGAAAEEPRP